LTTAYSANPEVVVAQGVYAPQEDSRLLISTMQQIGAAQGRRVADLCTGSGIVALSAALQGAASVTSFDLSPTAVRCARANALAAGVDVDVHLGSWARVREFGVFDLVVSNPPYVPHDPDTRAVGAPTIVGDSTAWDAGPDGRLVLGPLCRSAPALLDDGGTLLLVHSEFAGLERTIDELRAGGLTAGLVAEKNIPFGPVLSARAGWLEQAGLLDPGRRVERLGVIRAQRR
jgi:release factor glutamine methyltransferase